MVHCLFIFLAFTFLSSNTNAPIALNYTPIGSSFKDENLCRLTLDSAEIFCSGSIVTNMVSSSTSLSNQ